MGKKNALYRDKLALKDCYITEVAVPTNRCEETAILGCNSE